MAKNIRPTVKIISFALDLPTASTVSIAGDFNGWDNTRTPLRKGKDSIWKRDIKLRTGRYEYKFVVDGNWLTDPKNNNRIRNSFGSENSVLEI